MCAAMEDTPKNVPPEVIEALKRGDKQAAMKMLLKGRQITGIKDVMKLLQSLQESGVLKEVKQQVKVNVSTARSAPATTHPAPHPHPKPVASVPLTRDGLSPGEVPRASGKAMGFVVLLVIAAVVVFLILRS